MSSLEHMSIAQAQALGEEKVKNLMKENANQQLSSMSIGKAESMGTKKVNDLLNISNGSYFGEELETNEDEEEEPTIINNVVSGSKELINRYGVRQDIVIKNNKEDPLIKARRILSDNAKPKEEITVQCIGDLDYRIGFGVHMYLPFLPKYYDCLMYVKEVEHEWIKGGFFTSELTLTPSRVMDEQEWTDIEEDDEDSNESGGQVIEKAVTWALDICNDNSHGYSQLRRWSGIDFDCSSFVISAFEQAGVQLKENGANSTSDLKQACLKCGFEVVEGWDKTTAVGLQKGDILLNEANHTCLYIGDGKVANCSSDRGHPETGDQDGTEIQVQNFYVYHNGWDCALRYIEVSSEESGNGYSSQLVEFTKSWEGFVSSWDKSSAYGAIGYGTDASGNVGKRLKEQGVTSCTETEATKWLIEELNYWAEEVKKYEVKLGITLNQQAFDACVDISYQWGYTYLNKTDFMKYLGEGKYKEAGDMISGYPRRDDARRDILIKGKYTLND